jgi:hypothetical protein
VHVERAGDLPEEQKLEPQLVAGRQIQLNVVCGLLAGCACCSLLLASKVFVMTPNLLADLWLPLFDRLAQSVQGPLCRHRAQQGLPGEARLGRLLPRDAGSVRLLKCINSLAASSASNRAEWCRGFRAVRRCSVLRLDR